MLKKLLAGTAVTLLAGQALAFSVTPETLQI
jgi:hypothetical protein